MRLILALFGTFVFASAACGKYGPPQRTVERAPAPAPSSAPAADAPDEDGKDR